MDTDWIADLSGSQTRFRENARQYAIKLDQLKLSRWMDAVPNFEYHYQCIRNCMQQIDYHLDTIEQQCKKLDAICSGPSLCTPVNIRPVSMPDAPLLSPGFIQKLDEYSLWDRQLCSNNALATRVSPEGGNTIMKPCEETML